MKTLLESPRFPLDPHLTVCLRTSAEHGPQALIDSKTDRPCEYVVHYCNHSTTPVSYCHGFYTSDYEVAEANFLKKLENHFHAKKILRACKDAAVKAEAAKRLSHAKDMQGGLEIYEV